MFYSKELSSEQNIKDSTERCSGAANDAPNVLFSTNSCVSVYNRLLTLITGCQFGPDSLALDVTCVFNQTEIFCFFVQSHNISVYTVSIWSVWRWHITNCFITFILKWELIIIRGSSLFQSNTTDFIRVLMGMIRKNTINVELMEVNSFFNISHSDYAVIFIKVIHYPTSNKRSKNLAIV